MSKPRLRFRRTLPEPRRCWIRYSPMGWPGAPELWIDLARLALGRAAERPLPELGEAAMKALDDVVYLPPATAAATTDRDRLLARLWRAGIPVVDQRLCPPPAQGRAEAGPGVVWDPTAALVRGELDALRLLPAGASVLWPLVAGVTDTETLRGAGLGELRAAGVERVLPVVPVLAPAERRRFAEHAGETAFGRLFHGEAAPVRDFARQAAGFGLETRLPRPVPEPPARHAAARRLAAHFAEIGELLDELGHPEGRAQSFFRAARWSDRQEQLDLAALAREGNLGVLDWLDESTLPVAEEFLADGGSRLHRRLRAELVGESGT